MQDRLCSTGHQTCFSMGRLCYKLNVPLILQENRANSKGVLSTGLYYPALACMLAVRAGVTCIPQLKSRVE